MTRACSRTSRHPPRTLAVIVLVMAASACAAKSSPELKPSVVAALQSSTLAGLEVIGELKAFEEALGGRETENFLRYSNRPTADERCYVTGKLDLPEYYSGLRLVREDAARCTARSGDFDVFFYPVQAVASGEEPVSVALSEAPVERVLVVVPHEDFHNQPELRKAPTEVAEAAATLVGFVTASGFAKEKYGTDSTIFRRVDGDAALFLHKSVIVNRYYDELRGVYEAFRSGALTEQQALDGKADLFAELQESCSSIAPDPISFNKCPAVMNNAGLAFDRTYTGSYPVLHELYMLLGGDTPALVATLKQLLTKWPRSATSAADLLKLVR
jgi:predicted aminopeptidase